CNSIYKKTLFPLANPGVRTRSTLSHHYNITLEEPLFINPALSDPREHIRFRGSSPVALTPLGRTTIREIGLRKSTIARDGRMARFKHLNMCLDVVQAHRSVPTNAKLRKAAAHAKKILTEALSSDAEYSSMANDLLDDWQP